MSRREGAFVPVNCGAIPKDLASSELFGHAKGAFTGATADKPGMIRSADRGTLFLDEIGELPLEQQVVLLRVLQDHTVTPIGGSPRKVNFRLVVATNRDMTAALSAGLFREDLWARASGFVVRLPPLRERREDLGLILGSLLACLEPAAPNLTIRSDAAYAMLRHEWPQNIRELEQCMRAALALRQGDAVTLASLPESIRTPQANRPILDPVADEDPAEALDELRQEHLRKLLERTGGNLSEVARLMGKHRVQIQRWIRRYRIDPRRYRPS
jgi:DNA-binding NtrC family response regulator